MSCSSWIVYMMGGKLLFCEMLLPGCVKNNMQVLHSSHLAFSPIFSLETWWCNHKIIQIQLQLGRISALFYQRDQMSIWLITCWCKFMPWQCLNLGIRIKINFSISFLSTLDSLWLISLLWDIYCHMNISFHNASLAASSL